MSCSTILGFRIDGRPIYGFAGGAPDDGGGDGDGSGGDGDGSGGDSGSGDPNAVDANGLTEKGRLALAAERNTLKGVRSDLRGWKAVGTEFGLTTPEQIREALAKATSPGQQQPAVDEAKIRQQAEEAASTKANRRVARAEVKALAAGTFADPTDAVSVLSDEDLDDLLGRDGGLNVDAARNALGDILTKKPHWAKVQKEQPPDFDGGSRNTGGDGQQTAGDFFRSQVRLKKGH